MSAADCPGCGLPVATPADAGSWTPDGTVCWRGGRCEVSAADDADRALDRLLMARGAGETRPVGSASIDRLRQIAAAWHRAVHVDSSMIPVHICDLDAVLADVSAAHGLASELDAARRAATFAETERDTLRGLTDAMRADNVRLRAIVAGRETAPTPADVAAHALAHPLPAPGAASNGATCDEPIGLWLCVVDGDGAVVLRLAREADDQGPYLMAWSSDYGWCGTGDIRRACPLDASGRPCVWPTPALGATGEGR